MIELSDRVLAHIDALFPSDDRPEVNRTLRHCMEALPPFEQAHLDLLERICIAALKVSRGSLEELHAAARLAAVDWRDLLVGADFAEDVTAHLRWDPDGSP